MTLFTPPSNPTRLTVAWNYIASGVIVVSSENPPIFFEEILESTWGVAADINETFLSSFNIGSPKLYNYRVQGDCNPLRCPPISFEGKSCNQTMMLMNLQGTSIGSICRQLKEKGYIDKIKSIHRFSRPANTEVARQESLAGIDHSCNKLIEENFCGDPDCEDYCIDYDVVVEITADFRKIVGDRDLEGSGNISITGQANTWFYPWIINP